MSITRRTLLGSATAAALTPSAAFANAIPLGDLSAYLNAMLTAESPFTQINSDGTVSTGTVYIHRPGRVRFDYDGDDLLVMAGGSQVAIFDGRASGPPEQYPLDETPLRIILQRNVNLGQSGMVSEHSFDGTSTRVVARDPQRPNIGSITLVFTPNPIELRQWIITDEGGAQTTVILGALEQGGRIPARYFSIPQEITARNGN
ncbi:outer membrane lipoprotein carrier protein LolA [Rhodobacteraceae bacterium N5(2021)]|uniref:Outer membrane lipoprotein carrier protein LolA n=1 Tax=Gymnodinialimonas phycosphaerae TaxID=2841589 RepID=A0A975TT36_9RHOB|nr:outer membrane lipoprotein carrier protein LolA [Gymnodinialimonas phycosphaerae]MBY4894497.1 outer membrane lipoprotein carrier protein LolA [Gymnodinialimonas phycosphaerae]